MSRLVTAAQLGWIPSVPVWAAVVLATACAAAGVYLLVVAVAAWVRHPVAPTLPDQLPRLAVVVPAHDEEALIGRCLSTLRAQEYAGTYRLIVIADNCRDATAARAAACGAEVLVREDDARSGKGHALRWAFDRLLDDPQSPEAVVVVDADSIATPHLLARLVARHGAGARVVQGDYQALREDGSARSELRTAAFLLFHRVRFSGRAALGMPCTLVGNGMLIDAEILRRHPWSAFSNVEDLEYSVDLRLAGVRTEFAPGAVVLAPVSSHGAAAGVQRLRWEGGRLHVVRTRLPRLLGSCVTRRRWGLLDLALELAMPPLGVLAVTTVLAVAVCVPAAGASLLPPLAVLPALVAAASIAAYVLVGLRAGGAPGAAYAALAAAPMLVLSELAVRSRLLRGGGGAAWVRTPRTGQPVEGPAVPEAARPAVPGAAPRPVCPRTGRSLRVGGVPIDPVAMDEAVRLLRRRFAGGALTQVCTVNLDFLTTAARRAEVRQVLERSDLNLADGAPVVWLGRISGARVPQRIAGSDLVPALVGAAAQDRTPVFLLGGEHGAAAEAARRLEERNPGLVVAGVEEPPRRSLEEMDGDGLVDRINATGAGLVLVALGHPKQDLWLARNADRLHAGVGIGVGCTFDLIAGRRGRAPRWAQVAGLEWAYRLVHEPGRLGGRYLADGVHLLVHLLPAALAERVRRLLVSRRRLQPAGPVGR